VNKTINCREAPFFLTAKLIIRYVLSVVYKTHSKVNNNSQYYRNFALSFTILYEFDDPLFERSMKRKGRKATTLDVIKAMRRGGIQAGATPL
jgi:hypothetical protein